MGNFRFAKLVTYLLVFSLSTANSSAPHPISQDLWDANVSHHQSSFDNSKWPVLYEINLNAENITSESDKRWEVVFKEWSRFWVQYVSLPGVVLIGVIGNGITIHILAKKRMRSSTNVYLTALAVTDLIYLLFSFSMSWRHFPSINKIWLYWYYSPLGLWVTDASSSTSVWLTVSFTVERYIAVCHPLKRKIYCTEKSALCVSILVYMACFALTATTPFEWRATTVLNQTMESNEVVGEHGVWKKRKLPDVLPLVHNHIVCYPSFGHTCDSQLFSDQGRSHLSTAADVDEQRETRIRCQSSGQPSGEPVTVTLIAVVILFLICQMPTAIVLIYTAIHMPEQDSEEESVLLGLGNIFNLLVAINAASNFLLYTALCNKYRKHFCAILCFRKKVSIEQQ
ncbi:FMRFamide receptor [Orchesella cincta]|uniref:FMRFamide receptor n=1 Tax=Orchesella cincta TaxID=48709 RepID=A0A1D2MK81_ORCCI|nr:FMRFamide receptor [Orchesella cincta]